jgi:hypothetical protein
VLTARPRARAGETGEREPLADDRADGERVVGLAHAGGVDERDGVA